MRARALPESCSCLTPLYRGALFAIDDWRCAGHDTPRRREEWCRDDRIVVTRRGAWELEIAGSARLADPMHVTFWNRDAHYRVRHPVPGGDDCTVFRLTALGEQALREWSPSRSAPDSGPTFVNRSHPIDGRSYLLHRRVLERARRAHSAADPMAVEEPALAFLDLVAAEGTVHARTDHARRLNRYVDRACDIIARDFIKPLTVEGIARGAQCSPFHLSRLFRRATGVTLYRAVVKMRLRSGLERLLDEPANVARIALDSGFASHSHFADAFRAEYGCSPSEARNLRPDR
jgi:AraC family transcriptional regulator